MSYYHTTRKNEQLVLSDHWRVGSPPLLDLVEGDDAVGTQQTEQTIVSQSGATLTTEGVELPWVPSLLDIKRHLRLEADDDSENYLLVGHRESAAVMLLHEIGQDARVDDYIGESDYEQGVEYKWIKIDRSNVQSVQSVVEVDEDDNEFTIPAADYRIRYKNRLAFIQGRFNELESENRPVGVRVSYRRGFVEDAYETALLKQVMLDTVHSLYLHPGRLAEKPMMRSSAFNAAMTLLKDRRSTIKWAA